MSVKPPKTQKTHLHFSHIKDFVFNSRELYYCEIHYCTKHVFDIKSHNMTNTDNGRKPEFISLYIEKYCKFIKNRGKHLYCP